MKIGLTGGLASGKSTVAECWRQAGLMVIDSDEIVATLYRPGEPGTKAVRELFGPEFLTAEGAVDHERVATHVFADIDALARLEEAVHPLVRDAFAERARDANRPVVLEGTLLVEAGYAPDFDLLITVESSREAQLERAIARGLPPEQAEARLIAQGDGELRRRAAHQIIPNDGSLAELLEHAERAADEILHQYEKGQRS